MLQRVGIERHLCTDAFSNGHRRDGAFSCHQNLLEIFVCRHFWVLADQRESIDFSDEHLSTIIHTKHPACPSSSHGIPLGLLLTHDAYRLAAWCQNMRAWSRAAAASHTGLAKSARHGPRASRSEFWLPASVHVVGIKYWQHKRARTGCLHHTCALFASYRLL